MFLSWEQELRGFMCTRAYADGGDGYPTNTRDEGLLGVLNPLACPTNRLWMTQWIWLG